MKRAALAAALVIGFRAAAGAQGIAPAERPLISIESRDVGLVVRLSARGPGAVDPSKLRFFVRPYASDGIGEAVAEALDVRIGAAMLDPDYPPATMFGPEAVVVPFVLSGRPKHPGMYILEARPGAGFFRDTRMQPAAAEMAVWWPDDAGPDAGLRDLRRRLMGKRVYGYGVLDAICPGAWEQFYAPTTGVRVLNVARERGRTTLLGVGSRNAGPSALQFVAVDPIRVDLDVHGAASTGMNTFSGTSTGHCPVLQFADPWHAELAVSTVPPPRAPAAGPAHLRVGMTRNDVAWSVGFPGRYETLTNFLRDDVWEYATGAWRFRVAFAHDRVVHVDPPVGLP